MPNTRSGKNSGSPAAKSPGGGGKTGKQKAKKNDRKKKGPQPKKGQNIEYATDPETSGHSETDNCNTSDGESESSESSSGEQVTIASHQQPQPKQMSQERLKNQPSLEPGHTNQHTLDLVQKLKVTSVVVALSAMGLAILCYVYWPGTPPRETVEQSDIVLPKSIPAKEIRKLSQDDIPNQPDKFWKLIESSLRSLDRHPAPVCVVLSHQDSDSQAKDAIKRLSDKMEHLLSGSSASISFQGKELTGNSRSALDAELNKGFDNGHRVAVLYDIGELNLETAKAFYTFCDDNPNPRYPRTLLLLTISHGDEDDVVAKEWLDDKLTFHWSNITDEITPLLSRVANRWTVFIS